MSYHVYHTEGFILNSSFVNEASRFLTVFTRELGLIRSLAQGVRENRSKLRYSLQDLFFSKMSFVRGREIWRVVGAERTLPSDRNLKDKRKISAVFKISFLLRRFIHGETRDEILFDGLKAGLDFLENEELEDNEINHFSLIMAVRILNQLGYWPDKEKWLRISDFSPWNRKVLNGVIGREAEISNIINRSVLESHL